MKGKKYSVIIVLLCMIMFLFGCGQSFPEMTEEEYDQTVEFAVGLLLKYSNNDKSKLTKVNVKEIQKQREKEARAAAEEERRTQSNSTSNTQSQATASTQNTNTQSQASASTQTSNTQQDSDGSSSSVQEEAAESSTEESSNVMDSSDLAEGVQSEEGTKEDLTSSENENQNETNSNAVVLSSDYSQEIFDEIFLSYQGYSVSSTYPESSKSYVINADKGKKLLVLRFDLYNASASEKKVNILEKGILIQTLLNGENLGYCAVTFLPNDLTSYVGTVDSKAHESLVAVSEISEEASTSIQTLGMIVTIGGKEQEVTLK